MSLAGRDPEGYSDYELKLADLPRTTPLDIQSCIHGNPLDSAMLVVIDPPSCPRLEHPQLKGFLDIWGSDAPTLNLMDVSLDFSGILTDRSYVDSFLSLLRLSPDLTSFAVAGLPNAETLNSSQNLSPGLVLTHLKSLSFNCESPLIRHMLGSMTMPNLEQMSIGESVEAEDSVSSPAFLSFVLRSCPPLKELHPAELFEAEDDTLPILEHLPTLQKLYFIGGLFPDESWTTLTPKGQNTVYPNLEVLELDYPVFVGESEGYLVTLMIAHWYSSGKFRTRISRIDNVVVGEKLSNDELKRRIGGGLKLDIIDFDDVNIYSS